MVKSIYVMKYLKCRHHKQYSNLIKGLIKNIEIKEVNERSYIKGYGPHHKKKIKREHPGALQLEDQIPNFIYYFQWPIQIRFHILLYRVL